MPLVAIWRLLGEYSSSGKVRTISLYAERVGVLWKGKDWCQSDLLFEDNESGLFIGTPFPQCVFLGKIKARSSMMGEILNELSIEISVSKSGPVRFFCCFWTNRNRNRFPLRSKNSQPKPDCWESVLIGSQPPTNRSQPVRTDYNHCNCHSNIYIYVICI
jgi:hypothetical protein